MINSDFWKGKKVLLTGHTGFKGSWLLVWLHKLGAHVCGISLKPNTSPSLYLELIKLNSFTEDHASHFIDITDLKTLSRCIQSFKPDIVFHLAAQPLVIDSYLDPLATWGTNVIGTLNVLNSVLVKTSQKCSVVCITTDKVYKNCEWPYGYRENDPLGGHDPYSSSKAAAELGISSFRDSFCGTEPHQFDNVYICSARAGNVIGGGDWSKNRLIPDLIKSLVSGTSVSLRNPNSTRPWQHVIEPLYGYILLAQYQYISSTSAIAVNFGPNIESNKSVVQLVDQAFLSWNGSGTVTQTSPYHEASLLHLQSELAFKLLGWKPILGFQETVKITIDWYKKFSDGFPAYTLVSDDIDSFVSLISNS